MLESLLIIKLQVTQLTEYNHSPTIRNGKTFLSVSYDYGTTQVFFPLTIAKFLRILILKNICERLLLRVKLNLSKVWKLFRVRLTFIGNYFSKFWFISLLLNVQQFQAKLKRGCFFVNFHKGYISAWLLLRLTTIIFLVFLSK